MNFTILFILAATRLPTYCQVYM